MSGYPGACNASRSDALRFRPCLRAITASLACLGLAGCAAPNARLASGNADKIAYGAKPSGYPKTYIDHLDGYCEQVTESWRDAGIRRKGKTTWLKVVDRTTTNCPR